MGYTTEFSGELRFNRQLSLDDKTFLQKLASTRRMARKVAPEYGVEGEFYVEGDGFMGQDHETNIIDYNRPPKTQPSLWLQWVPTEDGWGLEWDGNEKFYDYIEWIEYIVERVLPYLAKRSGEEPYVLTGSIDWQGEEHDDMGRIIVRDNVVSWKEGVVTYVDKDQDIDNHIVWTTINSALTELGMKDEGGGDSSTGGIETVYSKGNYKVTIEMRN